MKQVLGFKNLSEQRPPGEGSPLADAPVVPVVCGDASLRKPTP